MWIGYVSFMRYWYAAIVSNFIHYYEKRFNVMIATSYLKVLKARVNIQTRILFKNVNNNDKEI